MQHDNWNASAGVSHAAREQAYAVQGEAVSSVLLTTCHLVWRLVRKSSSTVCKMFWMFVSFWNIPVLGPSDPQR